MFIETYYDERVPVPGSTSEPFIPYPELLGEELAVWQEYLPIRSDMRNLFSPFNPIPDPAIEEMKKAIRSFDRIEIWSRAGDPMAVGVIREEKPRYFSIVRWGDAKLTLAQVKRRLRVEKWLLRLFAPSGLTLLLAVLWITIGFGFTFN
jgi:hypothetical protein